MRSHNLLLPFSKFFCNYLRQVKFVITLITKKLFLVCINTVLSCFRVYFLSCCVVLLKNAYQQSTQVEIILFCQKRFLHLREKCVLMFNQYTNLNFLRSNKITEWFFVSICCNLTYGYYYCLKINFFYLVFSVNNTLHPNDLHDYECYKVAILLSLERTHKNLQLIEKNIFFDWI